MSVSSQQHSIVTIARTHLFFPQETWVPLFRCPLAVSVPSASSGRIDRLSGHLLLHLINCCASISSSYSCCSLFPSAFNDRARQHELPTCSPLTFGPPPAFTASVFPSFFCSPLHSACSRFLFFFLPVGLPSPTVAPSHILRDAAVPSIAPIGRGFCLTAITTFSSVFACRANSAAVAST